VKFPARAFVAILMLAPTLVPAWAQYPDQAEQATLVRDALASPYGKALIAELGKNLRADADPACLNSKGLAPGELEARGYELITKWGLRMIETTDSFIDKRIYAEKFTGGAEMTKLRQDSNVKRYHSLAQTVRQGKTLDSIFEQFDHYVTMKRIKLASVSPAATGNAALSNPVDAIEEKLDKLIAANKSAALKRYLALAEQDSAARAAAFRKDPSLRAVPSIFYEGVENDLEQLCISRR
jgi:hypothetical protein